MKQTKFRVRCLPRKLPLYSTLAKIPTHRYHRKSEKNCLQITFDSRIVIVLVVTMVIIIFFVGLWIRCVIR